MNAITRHASAGAKSRALSGKLLKSHDYQNLMEMRTFGEFVSYLVHQTAYSEVFDEPEKILHRNDVEIGMRAHLLRQHEKFYHYYRDQYRVFFRVLFMRHEVENLKLLIRAISRQEDTVKLGRHLVRSEVFSMLSYERILSAKSIPELVDALYGTPYHDAVRRYVDDPVTKMQFYMEMNLDRLYFKRLKETIRHFSRRDRRLMEELLGKNSDLLNLQWIYRAKTFYAVSPEEMLNYTLETGLRFDYRRLKELCYLEEIEALRTQAAEAGYGMLFDKEDILMERNMERYLHALMDDLLKRGHQTIIVPLAYMHKLEFEIRDLSTILECIKYGLPDIRQYLIRNPDGR